MNQVGLGGKAELLGLGFLLYCVGVGWATISDNATGANGDYLLQESIRPLIVSPVTAVLYLPDRIFPEGKNEKRRIKRIKRDGDSVDGVLRQSYVDFNRPSARLSAPISFLRYFDVKLDTIIRTHDSRALGAEYLNETVKPSNENCLLWCWETPRCNVAVFADKNPGSCYLFDCGPVTSFRCRFTSHGNYKSSILQPPSQASPGIGNAPYDFAQWKSQVSHENELASLRGNKGPSTVVSAAIRSTVPPPPKQEEMPVRYESTGHPQTVIVSESPLSAKLEVQAQSPCKHYQFPCRQNQECIAIYNVCDGIPQCPDASDEAEDLHCPKVNSLETVPGPKTETLVPPPTPPRSTLAPYSRIDPPSSEKHLGPPPRLSVASQPNPSRLAKPDNIDSSEDTRVRGPVLDQDRMGLSEMAYQKELLDSRLTAANRRPSMSSESLGGMEKQLDESRVDGNNWNPANYPMRDGLRDNEDYVPGNRDTDGSRYVPAQSSRTFNSKHSSFVAADGPYRQPVSGNHHEPSYSNPQWSSYNDNQESSGSRTLDTTGQARNPGLSDPEYNRYDPPLYREGALTNGGVNMDAVYRHQLETDTSGLPNYSRYRNDDRFWPTGADQQIPKTGYPTKNDESQMAPSELEQHLKSSSFLSSYGDSLNLVDRGPPYKGQHEDGGYGLSPAKPRHHPVYLDSVNGRIPHDHGPVVQPQVQNDESPEDAIYEPQAEMPAVRNNLQSSPKNGSKKKKENHFKTTTETTSSTAAPLTSTTKSTKIKSGGHPSSVHTNPVPGARAVSLISAKSGMTIAELKRSTRVHARESNSAVLALSLGLCVTVVLLVLIGCRIRNIRRRLERRGGRSSLAHDADYLVNGMYL